MNMNVNTKINGIKQMTLTVLYIQGKEREREKRKIPILFIQALDGSNR